MPISFGGETGRKNRRKRGERGTEMVKVTFKESGCSSFILSIM